jgi:sulfate/thiosulfate transport system substrate-binding protein
MRLSTILNNGLRVSAIFVLLTFQQGCSNQNGTDAKSAAPKKITNVSYDPTRELYKEFNDAFSKHWEKETGEKVEIVQSHGGSGKQARNVINGLEADVVTLALANDIDAIVKHAGELVAKDWQKRLPKNSSPYTSTIVFMVRKGNPKGIKDWDDLIKPGVEVVTPDPATSGGACWNYLAAWGFVLKQQLGDDYLSKLRDPKQADAVAKANEKAFEFVREIYRHVKHLDSGARAATQTFVNQRCGDVFLAWENEAIFTLNDATTKTFGNEIVVPSLSIRAEPSVAVVDKVVDKHGTRKIAEAYLNYLYSSEGQKIAAKNYYRPSEPNGMPEEIMKKFSKVEMFTIDDVFGGWANAFRVHFDKGGNYEKMSKAK